MTATSHTNLTVHGRERERAGGAEPSASVPPPPPPTNLPQALGQVLIN